MVTRRSVSHPRPLGLVDDRLEPHLDRLDAQAAGVVSLERTGDGGVQVVAVDPGAVHWARGSPAPVMASGSRYLRDLSVTRD